MPSDTASYVQYARHPRRSLSILFFETIGSISESLWRLWNGITISLHPKPCIVYGVCAAIMVSFIINWNSFIHRTQLWNGAGKWRGQSRQRRVIREQSTTRYIAWLSAVQARIRSASPAPVYDVSCLEAVGWSSYIAFASLRWSVKIATVAQSVGLLLPPYNSLIEVCKSVKRNSGTSNEALKLTIRKSYCRQFPLLEVDPAQELGNDTSCGLGYESAFLPSCPASRDKNALVRGRERIKSIFCIQRPVETVLLSLVVVCLLLGFAFNTIIVKIND